MELSKYPIERLFYFVAAIVPGAVALIVFYLASPNSLDWFLSLQSLTYTTKLVLAVFVSFIVGYSMTSFLNSFLGMLGGAYGGLLGALQPYKPSHTERIAPWREPRWRALIKLHLGNRTPDDTALISKELLEHQTAYVRSVTKPDSDEQEEALFDLQHRKEATELDDQEWAKWYQYYHRRVREEAYKDFVVNVRHGIQANLETAAVFVLCSMLFVKELRHHTWVWGLALFWFCMLLLESWADVREIRNHWGTLDAQIRYLTETKPAN